MIVEASIPGRYLSPEPMLQAPDFVEAQARQGVMLPSYAYAGDNPIENVDRDGLFFSSVTTPHGVAAMAAAGMLTGASVVVSVNSSQHSSPSSSSCGGPAFQPEPLSVWFPQLVLATATVVSMASNAKERKCNEHCINTTVRDVSGDPFWLCRSCCLGRTSSPDCAKFGPFPD